MTSSILLFAQIHGNPKINFLKPGVVTPPGDQPSARCCSESIALPLFFISEKRLSFYLRSCCLFWMMSSKESVLLPFLKLAGLPQLFSLNTSQIYLFSFFSVLY